MTSMSWGADWPTGLGPLVCVVGARPNFMRMAPILRAFASNTPAIPGRLLTVSHGTNTLVGCDLMAIRRRVSDVLTGNGKRGKLPVLWDGSTAARIAKHLASWLVDHHAPVGPR